MNSKITLKLAIALLALFMGGCNLSDRITSSALTEIDSGSVIYFDNFSNPESGVAGVGIRERQNRISIGWIALPD